MNNKNSLVTKLAFLSVSFMVTSAYAIQGSLPQLKAALGISQTQSEYLVTTPSFAVMIFVIKGGTRNLTDTVRIFSYDSIICCNDFCCPFTITSTMVQYF